MARYGREFGAWNRDYDMDYGARGYTGRRGWGGGYYGGGMDWEGANRGYRGGAYGGFGGNRGYDFDVGYGRGYLGGGYREGGLYGPGTSYRGRMGAHPGWRQEYDRDFGDRVREGWDDFRRGIRRTFRGGYDRGW